MIDHIMIGVEDFEKSKAFYKGYWHHSVIYTSGSFKVGLVSVPTANQIPAGASGYMAENESFPLFMSRSVAVVEQ